jgi:hypothetical protein
LKSLEFQGFWSFQFGPDLRYSYGSFQMGFMHLLGS